METATMSKAQRKNDRWIKDRLDEIEKDIAADNAIFNGELLIQTAKYHSGNAQVKGDQLICLLAMASLTPVEGGPVQASNTLIAKRMTFLKKFFGFVNSVGYDRACRMMGCFEEGTS